MKKLLTLSMVLGLTLVLAACGADKGGDAAPEAAPETKAPAGDAGSEAKAEVEEAAAAVADAAIGSAAKVEEAAAEATEEAPAETPAAAGDLNGFVGTSWAFPDGTEISIKDAETAVIKGGVVALIAPAGLDAELSFDDGNVTVSAMGQSRTGTWDGESFEMDGNVATKK